jgi:hypothetical protein
VGGLTVISFAEPTVGLLAGIDRPVVVVTARAVGADGGSIVKAADTLDLSLGYVAGNEKEDE